jgi:hypothetical protein
MKTVYRVESRSGLGPYSGFTVSMFRLNQSHNYEDRFNHPNPRQEDLSWEYGYKCGCDSLEKLTEWFSGFWAQLRTDGFRVYEYTVPDGDVQTGQKQVVFNPAWATRVKQIPWDQLPLTIGDIGYVEENPYQEQLRLTREFAYNG